jgi:hypothetical protein
MEKQHPSIIVMLNDLIAQVFIIIIISEMVTAGRSYPIWKGAGECVRWRAKRRTEVLPWALAKFPSPLPASSPHTILARFLNCSASVLGELNHRSIRRAHITDWFFLWCSVDGWGAMLQPEGREFRVPMKSIHFFNWPNPSSCTMPLGFIQLLIEMGARRSLWG